MLTRQTVQSIFEQQRDRPLSTFQKRFEGCYLVVGLGALLLTLVFWFFYAASNYLFLFVGLAYLGLWFWFRWDIANDRACARMMLEALADGRKQLAWVYRENELTPKGDYQAIRFRFRFTNKRHGTLAGTERTVSDLLAYFTLNFSQMSSGYSPELEQRFRRSPQDLKTNPARSHALLVNTVDNSSSNAW
jgi:uncharacterized membrane protein